MKNESFALENPVAAGDGGSLFQILSGNRREWLFWGLHTLFWAGLGLVGTVLILVYQPSMPHAGTVIALRILSGFLLTAGLRWIYQRPLFLHDRGFSKWSMVVGSWIALALLESFIQQGLMLAGAVVPGGAETLGGFRLMAVRIFTLAVWSGIYFGIHLLEDEHALLLRATKAELAARTNELRLLQAQLNPHFLFNALGAVLASKDDPHAVETVTKSLSDYLKFSLHEAAPLVPLSRELDALEKYLAVQTSRFGDNLVCRIQCDPEARPVMVPPMIIQPLLDNAFQHGTQTGEMPLQVWLTAGIQGRQLRITVANTGTWSAVENANQTGTSIRNLRQRLALMLGSEARVAHSTETGWVRVSIELPMNNDLMN